MVTITLSKETKGLLDEIVEAKKKELVKVLGISSTVSYNSIVNYLCLNYRDDKKTH